MENQLERIPMNILIISAYYNEETRGIPTTYKVARILSQKHNVTVLTSQPRSPFKADPNITYTYTKDYMIPDPINLNIMPWLHYKLIKVIKQTKPDIVIISKYIFYPILTMPLLWLMRKKTIIITDVYIGVNWFARSKIMNLMSKAYTTCFAKYLLRMADKVVLTHEELVEPTKKLGIKNYETIHNGINPQDYPQATNTGAFINITYVGRIANIKGIDILLQAADTLCKKNKKVRFFLVGDGKKIETNNQNIIYTGHSTDVRQWLGISDIFVMPSFSEGLPNAVIEAMACGLPVVATDIPGGMRVLVKWGKTGLTFKKGDPQDLAEKLELLINNPELRKRIGQNAKKHIQQNFDNQKISEEWETCLATTNPKKT